jgi:hypothetical protein
MILRRGSGVAWGLLAPLDAAFLGGTLALGALDYRRGRLMRWKGRAMRVGPAGYEPAETESDASKVAR